MAQERASNTMSWCKWVVRDLEDRRTNTFCKATSIKVKESQNNSKKKMILMKWILMRKKVTLMMFKKVTIMRWLTRMMKISGKINKNKKLNNKRMNKNRTMKSIRLYHNYKKSDNQHQNLSNLNSNPSTYKTKKISTKSSNQSPNQQNISINKP